MCLKTYISHHKQKMSVRKAGHIFIEQNPLAPKNMCANNGTIKKICHNDYTAGGDDTPSSLAPNPSQRNTSAAITCRKSSARLTLTRPKSISPDQKRPTTAIAA